MKLAESQLTMLARCERAAIAEPGGITVTTSYAQLITRLANRSVPQDRVMQILAALVRLGVATCKGNRYRPNDRGRTILAAKEPS